MQLRLRPSLALLFTVAAGSACSDSPVTGTPAVVVDAGDASLVADSASDAAVLDAAAPTDAGLAPSFDAGWGDASLPAPDLAAVCPTDPFEPNQSAGTDAGTDAGGRKLAVSAAGKVLIGASVTSGDPDFYDLEPTKKDPVVVNLAYVAAAGAPLSLEALDANGAKLATGVDAANGVNHALSLAFEVTSVDSVFLHVASTAAACQPYELLADTAVCTDAYEDNDTAATAAALRFPSGVQNATVTRADEDDYELPSSATRGTCVVHYTVPAGAADPGVTLNLFDPTGATNVGAGVATGTGARAVTVTWDATVNTAQRPGVVKVQAASDACTPYTLECTP